MIFKLKTSQFLKSSTQALNPFHSFSLLLNISWNNFSKEYLFVTKNTQKHIHCDVGCTFASLLFLAFFRTSSSFHFDDKTLWNFKFHFYVVTFLVKILFCLFYSTHNTWLHPKKLLSLFVLLRKHFKAFKDFQSVHLHSIA